MADGAAEKAADRRAGDRSDGRVVGVDLAGRTLTTVPYATFSTLRASRALYSCGPRDAHAAVSATAGSRSAAMIMRFIDPFLS